MVKRSHGLMSRKTRRLTGKTRATVSDFVKVFTIGATVVISQQAYEIGRPDIRYTNKAGKIVSKRGESYVVEIVDGNKTKQLISHPLHLKHMR